MSNSRELIIPDIGDFTDIPIIEVFVKTGDVVSKDSPLLTLESDKATLDVPSEIAGTIQELRVKVGDRVSKGSLIAIIQGIGEAPKAAAVSTPAVANGASTIAQSTPTESKSSSANSGQPVNITVPDIGDFLDVPIIEIFVKPGEAFAKDAPILTLESDKATLDIPAPFAGTLVDLHVKVGDRVSAGAVFATAKPVGAAIAAAPVTIAQVAAPIASPQSSPPPVEAGPQSTPSQSAANGVAHHAPSSNGAATNGSRNGLQIGPVHASPSIRRFARELGVELYRVRGSGPNGRVTRSDVQHWVKQLISATPNNASTPSVNHANGLEVMAWPKIDFAAFGQIKRVPLSRIKKLSGPNLHRNWVMIPHVTQHDEADITDLEAMRKAINAEQDVKVTMLAFLIVASVAVLKRFPDINASLEGDDLIQKQYYHIGFAADTPNGLVVPVIRDADRKGVLEIAQETSALAKKARDGKLSGADMQGGTFTISSLGGIGGTGFTPIINAPEVAILGVSKSTIQPVWDGKVFQPRLMLPLSLSYDHRVVDGAMAARFCATLAKTTADLRRALL